MTVSDTFSDWYDRMKSAVTEQASPGQQKGEELDSCVRQVMAQGHDRESAYAICNDTLKADLEKSGRDELLDTAREMSKYDAQVPLTFTNLVSYADVDVKGETDLDLPNSCRRCDTATRVKGSFMCPDCDPMVDEKGGEYELVGSGVQEAAADETAKGPEKVAARKQYLTPATVDDAPPDAEVKSDEHGLYYEVDGDVDQKADPMANGHDLDPETGRGTCETTGKEITAERMGDLAADCPHCGDPLSVFAQKAVPDNAVSISSRDEAPEDARVVTGQRGGLYYIPGGEEGDTNDGSQNNQIAIEDLPISPEHLVEGAVLNNPLQAGPDRVEVGSVSSDEVRFTDPETGELVGVAVPNPGEEDGEGEPERSGPDIELNDDLLAPSESGGTTEMVEKNREAIVDWVSKEHGDETASKVRNTFEVWTEDGYESEGAAPVWEAAASTSGTAPPPDFEEEVSDVDDEVVDALTDIMEETQEALREKFGNSLTAYRGFDYYEMEEYAEIGADSVEIAPQALESWTLDKTTSERYGTHAVEMEVAVEDVGFFSGFFMAEDENGRDVHEAMNEVTLVRGEEYSFDSDDIIEAPDPSIDPLFKYEADEGRMPVDAANWLRRAVMERGGDADQKAVPENAVSIDSRSEAPDGAKIIEGDRGGLYYIPDGEEPAEGEEENAEPEEVSADEIGEGDVGKNIQVTADGHTTEGELVGVEDVPGRDDTGQQLVIQGDSFVPSRIRVSSVTDASLAGGAEGGEGDGFNTGDATADELLELFEGSDIPEDLNPANGGNVRTLSDLGIGGGVNNSQMRVVRLNDGSEGFITSYRKATRTGPGDPDPEAAETAALADTLIEEMGGNAVESAAVEHGYVSKEVRGNTIEDTNPVVLDEDALRETMAAGAVLGNIDMHKQNLMQNADGEVVSVDNDMSGHASLRNDDPVEFELSQTYQVFNDYHRNRTEQGELETDEEDMRDFADSITEAANNVDLDELPDDEDNDQLQRMKDNIKYVQENPDWYEESGLAADVKEVIL